jgi:hypothetical protein
MKCFPAALACFAAFLACTPLCAKSKKAATPPLSESNAEAITPITLTQDGFSFQYPSNWTREVDEKNTHNSLQEIVLDCPKNSYLKFIIADNIPIDAKEKLKDILQSYVTAITIYTQKDIRRWGKYYGQGVQIEGKVMNLYPGGIRIFVSELIDNKHFIVTEYYYAEDIEAYLNGVEMIQNTLEKVPQKA